MTLFDFDSIQVWGPALCADAGHIIPESAASTIHRARPEYIEDAAQILFSEVCPAKDLADFVTGWLRSRTVAAYHGSRLDADDLEDIRQNGLRVLTATDRRAHLQKKLSSHPDWKDPASGLDSVLTQLGAANSWGKREGQVHATLSRAGLCEGFDHYLTHGSEFDQCAARMLLGETGVECLSQSGEPTLITLAVPGAIALKAANPYGIFGDGIPNLVRELINAWAYWLAYPEFNAARLRLDCGLIFYDNVPATWITSVENV